VTYAQHLHLPRHAAASNVALIPSFFDLALPLPEVAQQNMKQGQVQSLAHRIRQSGQPMFSTTSAGDRNARHKLVIDTYMILRDQLINKTVRDTNTTSWADRVAMATFLVVAWYHNCDGSDRRRR
jgi:hypothetical protein